MKKAWGIVAIIVLAAVILGVVGIGVGLITGADIQRIFSVLESRNIVDMFVRWINTAIETVNSVLVLL